MTNEAEPTEVAEGVFELRLPIPFEDGRVNTYLFADGGHVDLLDCGMNSGDSIAAIRAAVKRVGGRGGRLRRLLVTHIHPDHYGAAGVLAGDGAELYLHRLEVPLVHPRYLELEHLVAEVHHHLLIHGLPEPEAEVLSNSQRALRDFVTPADPAVQLDGAETIEMGRRQLRVEWTPGHSPGHVCLHDPADRLLFAGDQILPDVSPNIGLHPQSTPNPLDEYLESLHRLAALRPRLVLPAHGRPFTDPVRRVQSLSRHHRRRKDRIVEIVGEGEATGWEVAVQLWGVREQLYEKRLALQEALAHLQSLAVQGRLEKHASPRAVTWRRPVASRRAVKD